MNTTSTKYLMSYKEYNQLMHDNYDDLWQENSLLHRKESGLPVNIFVAEYPYHKDYGDGKQKFIKIQNNYKYKGHSNDLLLMTISDNPQLYLSDAEINIKKTDINKIAKFIVKYKSYLEQIAEGEEFCLSDFEDDILEKEIFCNNFNINDIYENSNSENQLVIEIKENNDLIVTKNLCNGLIDEYLVVEDDGTKYNTRTNSYAPRLNKNGVNLII